MSLLTDFLKLFKWDTTSETDLDEEFDIDAAMNENWDKIDAKAKEHDDSINTLEDVQAEQDSLIQKLKDNMINLTTEEDTSLHIEDAGTPPAKLKIMGNHYQETQEGTENLAVLNEGSITQDGITVDIENGEATMSGTNTSGALSTIKIGTAYLYEGQTYYFKRIGAISNSGNYISISGISTQHWFADGNAESNFVCEKTGEWSVYVTVGGNQTTGGTFKLMLSKESGADWVQGKKAIPSLEYPSEISTVKDEVNVIVSNKNLMPILTEYWEYTEQGIKNKSKNSGIRLTEFKLKAGQTVKIGFKLITKPSTDTTFSASIAPDVSTTGTLYSALSFSSIQNFNTNELYSKSYTATEDVVIRYVMYGNENSDIFEFQMWAELNALTDYVKHEEVKKTLDIQQEMLQGDDFDLENEKEVHNWKKLILNGTEGWQQSTIYDDVFYLNITDITTLSSRFKLLSDQYVYGGVVEDTNLMENNKCYGCKTSDTLNYSRIYLKNSNFAGLESFKAGLAQKNMILYYVVATSVVTQLDLTVSQKEVLNQLQNLDLFKGINNIYTEEGIALMQLNYTVDTKQTVDSLNDRITALEQQLNSTGSEG